MVYHDAMYSASQPEKADESWNMFSYSMQDSLSRLEEIVDDISEMSEFCRDEWCEAANCMLGEVTVAVFAVSEPHWAPEEDSRKLKEIKRKIHDLHAARRPVVH